MLSRSYLSLLGAALSERLSSSVALFGDVRRMPPHFLHETGTKAAVATANAQPLSAAEARRRYKGGQRNRPGHRRMPRSARAHHSRPRHAALKAKRRRQRARAA